MPHRLIIYRSCLVNCVFKDLIIDSLSSTNILHCIIIFVVCSLRKMLEKERTCKEIEKKKKKEDPKCIEGNNRYNLQCNRLTISSMHFLGFFFFIYLQLFLLSNILHNLHATQIVKQCDIFANHMITIGSLKTRWMR